MLRTKDRLGVAIGRIQVVLSLPLCDENGFCMVSVYGSIDMVSWSIPYHFAPRGRAAFSRFCDFDDISVSCGERCYREPLNACRPICVRAQENRVTHY
jgi:hypothetical protein